MIQMGSRRWWALGALTLAVLAVGLDGTILSVALPTLAGALHASETDLQWFSSGYLLVLAATTLPAGLLGDRVGRRAVLVGALALFGAGSAACAFSPSANAFIAARLVLGLAGAGIVVMALSALAVLFTEAERPRAVGVWAAANFVALPAGPIFGGWLLTHAWWGWVFLINVPVSVVGLIALLALVPETRAAEPPSLDPAGVLCSTGGLTSATYGFIEAGQVGWGDARAIVPMVAGLALLVAFFAWENRLASRPGGRPLVDPALFRSAAFTWGVALQAMAGVGMIGLLFALPQYFQAVLGTDAMGSGLRLLPLIGGMIVGAVPADRLARLTGRKIAVAIGFAILAGAAGVGATTTTASGYGFVAAWMAAFGSGMGLVFATGASAALSEIPAERSGVGAAVMQALQKVGGPFGAAVLGSVLSAAYQGALPVAGLPPAAAAAARESVFGGLAIAQRLGSVPFLESVRTAFVHGIDVSLVVTAGIGITGGLLALAWLPGGRPARTDAASIEREEPVAVGR